MKKFELLKNDYINLADRKLYRIRALIDFGNVSAGDLGGYVEKEENLSQKGNAWIYNTARVYGNAYVYDDAQVFDNVCIFDNTNVFDNTKVSDNAIICDNAQVFGNAIICDDVAIYDNARVFGNAIICDNATIYGEAQVYDEAKVRGKAWVFGKAEICNDAVIAEKDDYIVFKNSWSSWRYFTYTKSNQMWKVGCFSGTGEELVKKAYADSEKSGKNYELYVNFVKEIERVNNPHL